MKKFFLPVIFLSAFFLSLVSCTSIPTGDSETEPAAIPEFPVLNWETEDEGFQIIKGAFSNKDCSFTCVKIDLSNPKLKIVSTPDQNSDFSKLSVFNLTDFASRNKTFAAINTTQFAKKGGKYTLVGVLTLDGTNYSEPVEKYSALGLKKTSSGFTAAVIQKQTAEELSGFDYCFGGFFTVLKDNAVIEYSSLRNHRTAAGVSQDGRFLYLLLVNAVPPSTVNGLTFGECGRLLKSLGAYDAMEFDGGSSSCMVINRNSRISAIFNRRVPAALGFSFEE